MRSDGLVEEGLVELVSLELPREVPFFLHFLRRC